MDDLDVLHEAEQPPQGVELDTGLFAELHGCEKLPELLDSTEKGVEIGTEAMICEVGTGPAE